MQGERGSLFELQQYHRGFDSNKRRKGCNKNQIVEEDEDQEVGAAGCKDVMQRSHSEESKPAKSSKVVLSIASPNSPKITPRKIRKDRNLIPEESPTSQG